MAEQHDRDFLSALEDCITRLQSGETIDSCIRDYPQYAERLRALLSTGLQVRRAYDASGELDAVGQRVEMRLRTALYSRRRKRGHNMNSNRRILMGALAAVVIVAVFGVALLLTSSRQQEFSPLEITATVGMFINPTVEAFITQTELANQQIFAQQTQVAIASTHDPDIQGTPPPQATGARATSAPIQPSNIPSVTVTGTPAPSATAQPTMGMTQQPEDMLPATASSEPQMALTATAPAPNIPMTATQLAATQVSAAMITVTSPALLGGAATPQPEIQPTGIPDIPPDMFFEDYGVNPFLDTEDDHLSTFAMDVDTASYTLARGFLLTNGTLPPPDAIRPEEFINYFDAGYAPPEGDDAFAIHLDAAPAPFGFREHYLFRVGIQGRFIEPEDRQPVFLVFVIDVSGSMGRDDRLGLVRQTLTILVDELRPDDRVAIVTYADQTRVRLAPTPASERDTIIAVINSLQPEGSTYAEAGLRLGYRLAQENMLPGENTRIILLSDGVANVGETGPAGILALVSEGVDSGITLSTIGFGMGNYNDVLMEQLANDGNGNYYYVDNLRQARRVFVHGLTGTLQVIGYDARVQVDFNPDITDRYRLIGYENRAIADASFRDDTIDAGEVGAGHSVTALYEIALEPGDLPADAVIATVYIRYQDADTREFVEISQTITVGDLLPSIDDGPPSFRLHAAVAEFAEILRDSYWAQGGSFRDVLALAEDAAIHFPDDMDVEEFIQMVQAAIRISGQ